MLILPGQVPHFKSLTSRPSSMLTRCVTRNLLWNTCPSGAGLRTIVIYLLASAIYFIGPSSVSRICFVYNIDGDFQFLGTSEDEPMLPFISKYIIDLSSRKCGVSMVFLWGWEICSILTSGHMSRISKKLAEPAGLRPCFVLISCMLTAESISSPALRLGLLVFLRVLTGAAIWNTVSQLSGMNLWASGLSDQGFMQ